MCNDVPPESTTKYRVIRHSIGFKGKAHTVSSTTIVSRRELSFGPHLCGVYFGGRRTRRRMHHNGQTPFPFISIASTSNQRIMFVYCSSFRSTQFCHPTINEHQPGEVFRLLFRLHGASFRPSRFWRDSGQGTLLLREVPPIGGIYRQNSVARSCI